MPIYEYKCEACGHRMEALQKMSDDPLRVCPECEAPKLKKLVSAVAFRLKGSGWYETDFKAGDKKNLADSGGEKSNKDKKSTPVAGEASKKSKSELKSTAKPTKKAKPSE